MTIFPRLSERDFDMTTPLDTLNARRGALVTELHEVDRQIARQRASTADAPYVVERPDGTVYAGRYAGYVRNHPPQRFMYRAVAERRALADNGHVVPFSAWTNRRQTDDTDGVSSVQTPAV